MDSRGKDVVIGGDTSSEDHVDASAQFTQANPLAFAGVLNPIAAEDWIQEIKELLGVLEFIKEQEVKYATYKLVGEANRWWLSAKIVEEQCPGLVAITWSRFKEVFFDKYFPVATQTAKQYAAKFVELSRLAPHMIPNEPLKARMFEKGLRHGIRTQVVALLT
ncbi:uncharacterized protein LOC131158741 [Malania oleifera]|uniref:uncharacterized protein LOC131158741 n=1 Tax=Malania oleifera TaxID=397392 RepID=UPI0025AE381D|nr:uncharacterized protein LOC131158741 [Malania oleifera]